MHSEFPFPSERKSIQIVSDEEQQTKHTNTMAFHVPSYPSDLKIDTHQSSIHFKCMQKYCEW